MKAIPATAVSEDTGDTQGAGPTFVDVENAARLDVDVPGPAAGLAAAVPAGQVDLSAPGPELLTTREAANVLGTTPKTMRRLVDRGFIPCVQLAPRSPLRFRAEDVALFARLARRTAA